MKLILEQREMDECGRREVWFRRPPTVKLECEEMDKIYVDPYGIIFIGDVRIVMYGQDCGQGRHALQSLAKRIFDSLGVDADVDAAVLKEKARLRRLLGL